MLLTAALNEPDPDGPRWQWVLQSSGMGKSRLMQDISNGHVVVQIKLREGMDDAVPCDTELADWLLQDSIPYRFICLHYLAFYTAIWEETYAIFSDPRGHLRDRMSCTEVTKEYEVENDHASIFRILMATGSLRQEFFRKVIRRAQKLYQEDIEALQPEKAESTEVLTVEDSPVCRRRAIQAGRAWEFDKFTLPPLIIAFDDGEELLRWREAQPGDEHTMFCPALHLQAVLGEFRSCRILGLVLSSLATIPADSATRPRTIPLHQLRFDLLAPDDLAIPSASLTVWQVSSWEHICLLGRPLWGALHASGMGYDALLQRAKMMLWGEDFAGALVDAAVLVNVEQCMSVMSRRVSLAIAPPYTHNLGNLESTFVERHGGVCLEVHPQTRTIKISTPSEPMLALAAASIVHDHGLDSSLALLRTLRSLRSARSDATTLAAESIILDSLLHASRTQPPCGRSDGRFVPPVVSVVNFFKSLLTHPEGVFEAGPSEVGVTSPPRGTFLDEFSDTYIYLTHFVMVTDPNKILTGDYVLRAMSRGAGIVVKHPDPPWSTSDSETHAAATIYVPFVRKPELSRQTLSLIAVRVTDAIPSFRATPLLHHNLVLREMEGRMLSIMGSSGSAVGDVHPPVIRVLMSFSDPRPSPGYQGVRLPADGPARTASRRAGETLLDVPVSVLTSYDIWCRGLSPALYSAVSEEQAQRYKLVLELQCGGSGGDITDPTKQSDPCTPFQPWIDPDVASLVHVRTTGTRRSDAEGRWDFRVR
ncbi:hypothetical protein OH76DRAFT_675254 [Lentinus brumalis]|uniref:Uncharacterized protein n=1 Tax=Lentinus brumalis TaxID=2498619 RepID=A0A371D7C5_9APHY|nr:hypothetical protein OH76DRAFT_675254 [Polyporus brumalis]